MARNPGLVATKLQIPPCRVDPVERLRLVERLEAGRAGGRRLTLVTAPPGFGKTMLLRQWAVSCRGTPVAWLSLDAADNDPAAFVAYLSAALDPEAGATVEGSTPEETIARVINRLSENGTPILLILDDYHFIRNISIHELTAWLLEQGPACLHAAIGAREDPSLPLARLRARDALTEIRARDLRFSGEEAAEFYRRTMALSLAREDVDLLAERTEGWITGLQLAGIAIRSASGGTVRAEEAHRFVREFSGNDRFVVDYLVAEVLHRASEEVRDFLRRTSVLDRLSAGLCEAVTGAEESRRLLEQLESANLFLLPLDNRREWFRYHGLFAQVLRLSLNRRERSESHRRAAIWFRANGFPEEAARHERSAAAEAREAPEEEGNPVESLSAREVEILRLVAEGLSNQEIGERLVIAHSTVKRHVSNIFGKLQVGSRTQAVAAGRRRGLI